MSAGTTEKPKIIFVLGAPGSGKGTQCANIVESFNYVHLSAGDLLRAERNRPGSELAQTIEEYIQAGRIIPVAVTCSLLERAMNEQMAVSFWRGICEKFEEEILNFLDEFFLNIFERFLPFFTIVPLQKTKKNLNFLTHLSIPGWPRKK